MKSKADSGTKHLIANAQLVKLNIPILDGMISSPRDLQTVMLYYLRREGITMSSIITAVIIEKLVPSFLIDKFLEYYQKRKQSR